MNVGGVLRSGSIDVSRVGDLLREKTIRLPKPIPADLFDSVGRRTSTIVVDDEGRSWPAGSLVLVGAEGVDDGNEIVLALVLAPVDALHPVGLGWLGGPDAS